MDFNIMKEIVKNEFLLVLLREKEYLKKFGEMMKSVERGGTKICYVCLSKPYKYVVEDLREMGLNTDNFFFVDVLSSHYGVPASSNNCVFLKDPNDLDALRATIKDSIGKRNCSVILFDTISTLLIYQETSKIVKFTHSLLSENESGKVKKLFIVLKDGSAPMEDNKRLFDDLSMFADKTIDIDK